MNPSPSSGQLKKYKVFPASRLAAGSFLCGLQKMSLRYLFVALNCYTFFNILFAAAPFSFEILK